MDAPKFKPKVSFRAPQQEATPPLAPQLSPKRALDYDKGAFRQALVLALEEMDELAGEPGSTLVNLMPALIHKAADGHDHALRMIAERLDGKAPQALELTGEGGGAIRFEDVSDVERARRIAYVISKGLVSLPHKETPPPLGAPDSA